MDSSVASDMVHSNKEDELASSSAEDSMEYPFSQELIRNSGQSPESENLSVRNETNDSENSLFQEPSCCAPTRTRRIQRGKKQAVNSLSTLNLTSDDSAGSDYEPMSKKIAKYLKNPYRKWWQKRKQKKKKIRKTRTLSEKATKKTSIPLEEKRRRLRYPGIHFPCTPSKYLPLKSYFTYEQFVVGGFLNQVKNLKYERTLKKGLKDVNVDEDSDYDNFDMRKYSFLDEDAPISPISEPGENLNEEEPEPEIEVVEMSDFILSCKVPSKKKWRLKKEKKSSPNKT